MTESVGAPPPRRSGRGTAGLFLAPLQKARELLLRPARHELGDARAEIAQLRGELEQTRAQLRAEIERQGAALDASHLEGGQTRQELSALAASTAAALASLQQGARELAPRVQLLEQLLAEPPASVPGPAAPLVSIVMPTRNRAGCIAEAVASVFAQSYSHWELLIVDDGGEDATEEVLAPWLADARLRYARVAHGGAAAARNHALRNARGELIAYLDSDNLWFPGFLAAAVGAFAEDAGVDLLYGVLATQAHGDGNLRLLFEPFERARLEQGNFIDVNVVVHRRALYEALGGFDPGLVRIEDWDLLLRYTARKPARALPVLAARYRVRDAQRVTCTVPIGPSWLQVRRSLAPSSGLDSPVRVLHLLSGPDEQSRIEAELRCMRRCGAEVATWSAAGARDTLHEAVRAFDPDVLHVHGLALLRALGEAPAAFGLPCTLRLQGEEDADELAALPRGEWLRRAYAWPRQWRELHALDARLVPMAGGFDSSLFAPATDKDRSLVLCTTQGAPASELRLFLEVASALPSHRFVLCGASCERHPDYPAQLAQMAAALHSPAELRFDLPRGDVAGMVARAGIYLHVADGERPAELPVAIAEAMATGAYVLARDQPGFAESLGDAGAIYRDAREAAALVAASEGWSEAEWRTRRVRASDLGYFRYADEIVLRPLLGDWQALARERRGPAAGPTQAA